MAKTFDMGAFAQTLNAAVVSDSDTNGRDQIEYIDISLLDRDPGNFYELGGLDELAANIQLCGLQQPLRVRSGESGRVTIVSGHRRRKALQKLIDAGQEQYRAVPCIRERDSGTPALQELRLIYANADTRKMTTEELSTQAERVEALLYQLQSEGYEFPGRMRDQVAAACNTSATKIANLKIIREKLLPEFKKHCNKTELSESVALCLARMPAEHQKKLLEYCKRKDGGGFRYFYENAADRYGNQLVKLDAFKCKLDKSPCSNKDQKWAKLTAEQYSYAPCADTCCAKCSGLARCKYACPKLAEEVKALRADAKAQSQREEKETEEKERPDIEQITAIWARFSEARAAAGKSVEDVFTAEDIYFSDKAEKDWLKNEAGEKITTDTKLPFGYNFFISYAKKLLCAAELLGVSVDFLLCRTDYPGQAFSEPGAAVCAWRHDTEYPINSWILAIVEYGFKKPARKLLYFDSDKQFHFAKAASGFTDIDVLAWMPFPEIPENIMPAEEE